MATVRHLSVDVGVRHGGSSQERAVARYLQQQMERCGYTHVVLQPFPLPHGHSSVNVVADKAGAVSDVTVVGAHMDSKGPSPGANDNGSGVASLLEVARLLQPVATHGSFRFIFFGSEEVLDRADPDGHHFGSRYYVSNLTSEEASRIHGMICIDAVAAGPHFVIGNMEGGSPLAATLRRQAQRDGQPALDQQDPGWSDHEAFEQAGIPVAYVRWRIDDTLHTSGDNFQHIQPAKMQIAGQVVLDACRKL